MKPSIPKGTRDFLPEQAAKRAYLFDQLKAVFKLHGFLPVETPAMEKLETLTGKYGEEGDRLIFKILARGRKLEKALENKGESLAEEALRYDLTVPFARMVVQYQNEISFPFKRYQIQPVWRADRPQKGRYREFFQCDVDMIGSDSLLNEVELIQVIAEGFERLGLPDVTIKLNNRKVLQALAEYLEVPNQFMDLTIALDKLDKIGFDGVEKELREKGLSDRAINTLKDVISSDNKLNINNLKNTISSIDLGKKGIDELTFVLNAGKSLGIENIEFDLTLARGLNYYTGAIFEVVHPDFPSSICGGGRYDDLTGIFGLKDVSGVGVSFGADRIFDLMEEKDLFPENLTSSSQVLFVNFGPKEANKCLEIAKELRANNISCELYPDAGKLKKQFKYADDKHIPFVVVIGTEEIENELLTVKQLSTGTQTQYSTEEFIHFLTH